MSTPSRYQIEKLIASGVVSCMLLQTALSFHKERGTKSGLVETAFWILGLAAAGLFCYLLLNWPRVNARIPFDLPCEIITRLDIPKGTQSTFIKIYSSCSPALYTGCISLFIGENVVDEVRIRQSNPFWLTLTAGGGRKEKAFVNYSLFSGFRSPFILRTREAKHNCDLFLKVQLTSVLDSIRQDELERRLRPRNKMLEVVWRRRADDDAFWRRDS